MRVHVRSIALGIVAHDGVPEFEDSGTRSVMRLSCPQGIHTRPDYVGRGIEVGFSHLQMDDVQAVLSHFHGSLQNVHHQKGRDVLRDFRDQSV